MKLPMKLKLIVVAALSLTALSSQAAVTATLTTPVGGSFIDLAALPPGFSLSTGSVLLSADAVTADIPKNPSFGWSTVGAFLAVGPSHNAGAPATLSFAGGVHGMRFLWGSPDSYNSVKVTTTLGDSFFGATAAGITTLGGDQNAGRYVNFSTSGAERITALTFINHGAEDAFEVSNFAVTAVPEPQTIALLAAGLLVIGRTVQRRSRRD